MKDSGDPSSMNENLCSSLRRLCVNEISIRNHSYIISMCINDSEQTYIDLKIEAKESADQWRSTFDTNAIETMTAKTGNFKSFNVFIKMLENALYQKSSSVSIDILTSDDLDLLRNKQHSHRKASTKRYLVLIYNAEYDCVYYPLTLEYCGKPDPIILIGQIHQLATENQLLKSRFRSDTARSDLEQECSRLKKANDDYCHQLSFYNAKEKDQQIEFLRQMVRKTEDALIKEQSNLKKTKTKKNDRYNILMNQIDSLKTTERQLKVKVKDLSNEIDLLKQNRSSCNSRKQSSSLSRSTSSHQHHHRSPSVNKRCPSSTDSHVRFNPTAYVHERTLKFRQIELQKKKETHRRLSAGRHPSDSDISNASLKSNENGRRSSNSKKHSSQKRTNSLHHHKPKELIDSDIEQVSSLPNFRKSPSNNSTILFSPVHGQQNSNISLPNPDNIIDIDQRLKSLEQFIKQNF